jgi:hypothetical protein
MNPATYRRDGVGNLIQRSAYGIPEAGEPRPATSWDVDHSKPLAAGGTYHPNNLQAMQWQQNEHEKRAQYPYSFATAQPVGIPAPVPLSSSSIDGSSELIRNGQLLLNRDGTINQTSAAVRNGSVIVRSDGQLDERSAALQQGLVFTKYY